MTESSKIREFLNLLEGELLPNKHRTIKVAADPYTLYRTLLRMPEPQNYVQPAGNGMTGVLTYIDNVSFEADKAKLRKFGIKFEEDDGKTNNMWDTETQHGEAFAVSPFPGNGATGNDTKNWKDNKPTANVPLAKNKKKKSKS